MTYATRQDLENAYGADEITQRESMLAAGAVNAALANADATINGYLAKRYTLPLTTVPANLAAIAGALARYTLVGDSATERARADYKDAIVWLKDVAAGVVLLDAAAPAPGNEPATVAMISTSPAVFKREGRP